MRPVHDSGNTGQKPAKSIRQHVELVREKWMDVERRIRQRMRVYPEKLRAIIRSRAERSRSEYQLDVDQSDVRLPAGGRESLPDPESGRARAEPVTSIPGHDLEEPQPHPPPPS